MADSGQKQSCLGSSSMACVTGETHAEYFPGTKLEAQS
jgi:hypothetical protein